MNRTDEAVVHLPISELHESPFNPRRRYSEKALQELATDIAEQGVQSPIIVRARMIDPTAAVAADMFDGYELVFGHRRLRSSLIAAKPTMPCIVRSMTDQQVKRAQISENLQREDVHPIEEAEGFQALLNDDTALTPLLLAEQFGKSPSYVYGRLKLLQACPEIREACLNGEILSEVALLISRLPNEQFQQKALGYIRGKAYDLTDGGKRSFRSIRDLLNERFTLDLKKALFDIKDATLLPGAGSCETCPKRTANAPEFDDVLTGTKERHWCSQNYGADVCTDPDCFDEKKKAHLKRQADVLTSKGKHVIDGNKARQVIGADGVVKNGYVAIKSLEDPKVVKARLAAQKDSSIVPPLIVTIQNPRDGKTVEAVKVSELQQAGIKITEPRSSRNLEQDRVARDAEHKRREAAAKTESARRLAILQSIRTIIPTVERSTFDLQLIARTAYRGVSWQSSGLLVTLWGHTDREDLEKSIGSMNSHDLTIFLFDCALVSECAVAVYELDEKPATLLAVAKHYGIDTEGASTPSTAAHTGGDTAAKGKKKVPRADKAAPAADSAAEIDTGKAGKEVKDEPAAAGDRVADLVDQAEGQ